MGNLDMSPTTFQITSTPATLSAMWVGTAGPLEVTKVTQFQNDKVYFTTTVTLKNIGTSILSNLYCKLFLLLLIFYFIYLLFFINLLLF